ncbi:hypothetical protein ARMSODRAFT_979924 [Armillaria solidipes]|uniref:Uncharacterized protein n=1 Tax=Armillaria solidipes TaxID=1076256 RepID=A0A2H3AXV6_9AGAR|nr:hypothetical protein ARMSODRAFT_979924 [Armillaria solidipes]
MPGLCRIVYWDILQVQKVYRSCDGGPDIEPAIITSTDLPRPSHDEITSMTSPRSKGISDYTQYVDCPPWLDLVITVTATNTESSAEYPKLRVSSRSRSEGFGFHLTGSPCHEPSNMFLISGVAFSKSDLRAREGLDYTSSLYLYQSQNIIEVSNLGLSAREPEGNILILRMPELVIGPPPLFRFVLKRKQR